MPTSPDPYKITLVMPAWERIQLTLLVLRYYNELAEHIAGITFRKLLVYSPEDRHSHLYADVPGWESIACQNIVSTKVALGYKVAKREKHDAVMLVASDTLITEPYFHAVRKLLDAGEPCALPGYLYFYGVECDQTYGRPLDDTGVGKAFPRDVLEQVDYDIIPEGYHRIDNAILGRMGKPPRSAFIDTMYPQHGTVLHIGVENSMTPFNFWRRQAHLTTAVNLLSLLDSVFPDYKDDVLSIRADQ